jgi:hypothetical protein
VGHRLDVVPGDVRAAVEERPGLRRQDEPHTGSRARAELDVRRRPRRADQVDHAVADVVGDGHLSGQLLGALEAVAGEHPVNRGIGRAGRVPLDDLAFLVAGGVIDQEGTYPLQEAQTDRFLLKILVDDAAPGHLVEHLGELYVGSEDDVDALLRPGEDLVG